MAERNTLLAVFAHPDDESLVAGGTLAGFAAEGWRTALICATRGEWGSISDKSLADHENLGAVRERELREACQLLGVGWLQFLGLTDGSVATLDANEEEAALEQITRAIRELRPQIVITFGPDGLYGHSDHIAIGQLTTRACKLAWDRNAFPQSLANSTTPHQVTELLYATVPQGLYPALIAELKEAGREANLWGISPDLFGILPEEITTIYDVTKFLNQKLAALGCHRTQLDDSNALSNLGQDIALQYFSHEFFTLAAD